MRICQSKKGKIQRMNKFFTVITLLIILATGYFIFIEKNISEEEETSKSPITQEDVFSEEELTEDVLSLEQSTTDHENKLETSFDNQELLVTWEKVSDLNSIELYNNLDKKYSSTKAKETYSCNSVISAGFYNEEKEFVGLFISDGKVLKQYRNNNLFNGVLSINYTDTPRITRPVPTDPLRIAVQTGPILIENGKNVVLNIKNDHKSRRVVASVNGSNELYFLAIHQKNSFYNGPELSNLPMILNIFEEMTDISIADAINLDGGTASSFIVGDWVQLKELSLVGAFFCLK